jgi:rhamnose utilization protein RhaD (predicted bifunctional aldolase and dehydrogenase)
MDLTSSMEQSSNEDLRALERFSADVGTDPRIVQAAGGNSSVKSGSTMWVKASGGWLAEAQEKRVMVPVSYRAYRDAVLSHSPRAQDASSFVEDGHETSHLRPSVETAMHAILPQKFVLHVHCVDTIAWAIQADAATLLSGLLDRLDWAFIPYVTPGLPLARAIARDCAPGVNVIVLGNHGLVVAAETIDLLGERLRDVRRRLARVSERDSTLPPDRNLEQLQGALSGTRFRPARDPYAHSLAFDPVGRKIAAAGTLYPDHAVFMGPAITVVQPGRDLKATLERLLERNPAATSVIVAGLGMALRDDALRGTDEMSLCLANVMARLGGGDRLNYLPDEEIADLLAWDAEKYRQAMNAADSASEPPAPG